MRSLCYAEIQDLVMSLGDPLDSGSGTGMLSPTSDPTLSETVSLLSSVTGEVFPSLPSVLPVFYRTCPHSPRLYRRYIFSALF
jgi:hypothetical protein